MNHQNKVKKALELLSASGLALMLCIGLGACASVQDQTQDLQEEQTTTEETETETAEQEEEPTDSADDQSNQEEDKKDSESSKQSDNTASSDQTASSQKESSSSQKAETSTADKKTESTSNSTTASGTSNKTEQTASSTKPAQSSSSANSSSSSSGSTSSNKPASSTASSSSSSSASAGTSSSSSTHTHTWKEQYKTVHHDETGHYETVTTKAAWTETVPVYGTVTSYVCNDCGKSFTYSQIWDHVFDEAANGGKGSYSDVVSTVQTGTQTIEHEAETTKKYVVDKEAYDEKVSAGYKCTGCSATK